MTEAVIHRPDPAEYPPYFARYVELVPDGDVLQLLARQRDDTLTLLAGLTDELGRRRYAPGKWSINEVVGHLADTERVFAYRALRFSRGDPTPLPGFEQDEWAAKANHHDRSLSSIAAEFHSVREATLHLLHSLTERMLACRGTADGNVFTVRAVPSILAGHERHHVGVIRDRYL